MHAYFNALRNYFVIRGRTSNRDFWMFVLFNILIFILLIVISLIISLYSTGLAVLTLLIPWFLYVIFITIPSFTITIRRLHDVGKSGWWYFISFIPLVGQIWFMLLLLAKGEEGKNDYGEAPARIESHISWRKVVTILMFVLFSIVIVLFFVFGIKDLIKFEKQNKANDNVNEANKIMDSKDISKSNFEDFNSIMIQSDLTALENSINTKQYENRDYYEMFNELYFKFHVKDNTEINRCINNKETGECTFYNAVLNNNEQLCDSLPTVRKVASPGKYGTSYFDSYYKLSCILNARMLHAYNSQSDKISFCKSFSDRYIQNQCLIYTCESYYWNKDKPEECTSENVNSWFGVF